MKIQFKLFSILLLLVTACGQSKNEEITEQLDALLKDALTKGIFSGHVMLSKNDQVIYYNQFGYADWGIKRAIDKSTLFNIGSLNKQFTEEIIHQLVKEKKLNYSAKLSNYLNFLPAELGNKITIQQLLDMKAGFGDYLQNPAYDEMRFSNYSLSDLMTIIQNEPLLYEPGTQQIYSNSGYVVLGAIIEKITQLSYEQNIQKRIAKPLELDKLFFSKAEKAKQSNRSFGTQIDFDGNKTSIDDIYNSTPAGGMYTNIGNLLKFAEAKQKSSLPSTKKYGDGMFAGGTPVWNSLIYYNDKNGYCFVIMANVGNAADQLAPRIISILNNEKYPPLEIPFKQKLYKIVKEKGPEYVKENIRNLCKEAGLPYDDQFLNYFGYEFLNSGKTDLAIQLFKINTELFPKVPNTFDSLAEGFVLSGDTTNAIKYYKQVLNMDPRNTMVKNVITDLEAGSR